jgi:NADP-dependent 3-hydroxy acid dehydrogenase YdfG
VNNAGAIPRGDLQAIDEQRWRDAWDLKVSGYINMCRRFYVEMKARGRGVIINILGMAGEKMDRGYIAGSTGNAALMAFTPLTDCPTANDVDPTAYPDRVRRRPTARYGEGCGPTDNW